MATVLTAQTSLMEVISGSAAEILSTPPEEWTLGLADSRLDLLEDYWRDFLGNHLELLNSRSEENEEYFLNNSYRTVESQYVKARGHLYEQRRLLSTETESVASSHQPRGGAVKLPRIEIPRFDGRRETWESFRDYFRSLIHDDQGLSDVQKLHFLKGHVDGEAKRALEHLAVTGSNYTNAWEILEARYDQPRLLVQQHIRALIGRPQLKKESGPDLQRLLDDLECHRSQLQTLNRPISRWDDWFLTIASDSMDPVTRRAWEEEQEKENPGEDLPTFEQLSDFLQRRCRTLSSIEVERTPLPPTTSREASSATQRRQLRVFATSSGENYRCPSCQAAHLLWQCDAFKMLSPSGRKELIVRHRLCFNCLRDSHRASRCPSRYTCAICSGRHHSLLHDVAGKRPGDPIGSEVPPKVARDQTMVAATSASHAGMKTSSS